MKSGRDEYGRERGMATENVIIADCIVYHGHGGFTIGSEMSGGVRNVKVNNCNFIGTDVGLRFKSTRGRGGVVENIYIDNIFMKDIPTKAVSFNMFYDNQAPTEAASAEEESNAASMVEVTDETPVFRKIYLNNIICNGAEDAVVLQGLPEMPISEIHLSNISMISQKGISIFDAEQISITNAVLQSLREPVIKIVQGVNVIMDSILYSNNTKLLSLAGNKTATIIVRNSNIQPVETRVEFGGGVGKEALIIEN
jgi:polygalacturonase